MKIPITQLLIHSLGIVFLVTSFDLLFSENFPVDSVYSFLKMYDELYVLLLFVFTLFYKGIGNNKVLKLLMYFSLVGFISGFNKSVPFVIQMLGWFSIAKPVILFWCLTRYRFKWAELHLLFKYFTFLYPVIVVSYLLDLCIPSFRSSIGIVSQAEDIRMGIRSLGGLFNRFTIATLFALVYFLYFGFYKSNIKKNRKNVLFSLFMIISSLKIKDLLGLCVASAFLFFNKFKTKNIVLVSILVFLFFNLYAYLLPEHYNHYFSNDGDSNVARVVLTTTAFIIANVNIPFGVGFGQYASPISRQYFSNVYTQYGIDNVYGLSFVNDGGLFMCDTFWPMIIGETGYLGLLLYILLLYGIFGDCLKAFFKSTHDLKFMFVAIMFISFLAMSLGKPVFSGPPHCLVLFGFAGVFYSFKKNKINQTDRFK